MIIVDESNLELSNSLISSLKGRGIECGLFSSIGENFPNVSEKIFLSCRPEDFDLKSDKEFIPFLKSNGFIIKPGRATARLRTRGARFQY